MELPAGEVHLYFSFPGEISDPGILERYESLLTGDELSQMSRLYFARHRHQFLISRALIRTALSSYYPVEPAAWRFCKNGYGKPLISFPDITAPISFNLSHCDGLILFGITRGHDIGVDVEDTQRSTNAAFDCLSRYFSPVEIADLAQLSPEHKKARFFDYWTLKESYIKARGMGLAIPLDKFSFQFRGNTLQGLDVHPDLQDDAADWQFWRIPLSGRYLGAVAVNSRQALVVRAFNSAPLQGNQPLPLAFL
jgi:4'-phosphopantetheinyl transferase